MKKQPSAFNIFMKETVSKIKKEQPNLKHTEAFSLAAAQWKASDKNPNKK